MTDDAPANPVRKRAYTIVEAGRLSDPASVVVDGVLAVLILANVAAFALSTVDPFGTTYAVELELFNIVSVLIFTVEYFVRLWVAVEHPPLRHLSPLRCRLRYALSPLMLIDLIAIAPFYLSFFIAVDLRVLRVFRLLRFFKLARYSPALVTLGDVIYQERRPLLGALLIMVGLLLTSASVMFFIENEAQPDVFSSVPAAMWWALATLTTVGYGDVVPVTPLGKIVGGLVMVFGLGMFSLPIGIIATGFAQSIHRRDFVVSWGMISRVPIFEGLSVPVLQELMELLETKIAQPGELIALRGEDADGMYFIVSGEVEIELPRQPISISDGEFFGEMSLLGARQRSANVRARTRTRLLKLSIEQFESFMRRHPSLQDAIANYANERIQNFEQNRMPEDVRDEVSEIKRAVAEFESRLGEPNESGKRKD